MRRLLGTAGVLRLLKMIVLVSDVGGSSMRT